MYICTGVETVFLDEEFGVFHCEKQNLNLGTDDCSSRYANYRFVSREKC